jgi:hypothetical protein
VSLRWSRNRRHFTAFQVKWNNPFSDLVITNFPIIMCVLIIINLRKYQWKGNKLIYFLLKKKQLILVEFFDTFKSAIAISGWWLIWIYWSSNLRQQGDRLHGASSSKTVYVIECVIVFSWRRIRKTCICIFAYSFPIDLRGLFLFYSNDGTHRVGVDSEQ